MSLNSITDLLMQFEKELQKSSDPLYLVHKYPDTDFPRLRLFREFAKKISKEIKDDGGK